MTINFSVIIKIFNSTFVYFTCNSEFTYLLLLCNQDILWVSACAAFVCWFLPLRSVNIFARGSMTSLWWISPRPGWNGTQWLVKLCYGVYIAGHRRPLPVILTNHSHVLDIPYRPWPWLIVHALASRPTMLTNWRHSIRCLYPWFLQ